MSSLNPSVIIVCVLIGSGAIVLAGAAFYHVASSRGGRGFEENPFRRNPEQDAYMREVRQRELHKMYGGGGRSYKMPQVHVQGGMSSHSERDSDYV